MIVTGESEVLGGKLPSPPTSNLQLLILSHLPNLSPDVGKDVVWVCGLTSDYLWDGLHFSALLYHVVLRDSESTWRYISSGHKSPRLLLQHAALPGLPRYLLPSILESFVRYPAFYKYGTSLRSYGCKVAWNAGLAGRESVQSPPLFQREHGANYISLSQTVNEAQGTINILWIDLGSSPP